MICAKCGKTIQNSRYLNGKYYGIECYKKELTLLFKVWEDEKNLEYSRRCISAMAVCKNCKENSFRVSILEQWEKCHKLTIKQLNCILAGFNTMEMADFYFYLFEIENSELNNKNIEKNYHKKKYFNLMVNEFSKNPILFLENGKIIDTIMSYHERDNILFNGMIFVQSKIVKSDYYVKKLEYLKEIQEDEIDDCCEIIKIIFNKNL